MESRIRRKVYVRFGGGGTPYPQGSTVPTLQTLIQVEETISATLAKLQAQSAAYERAQSVERLTDNLTMESLRRINEAVMEDHP